MVWSLGCDSRLLRFMLAKQAPCDQWCVALDLHNYDSWQNPVGVMLKSSMPYQAKYRWISKKSVRPLKGFGKQSPHLWLGVCHFKSPPAPSFSRNGLSSCWIQRSLRPQYCQIRPGLMDQLSLTAIVVCGTQDLEIFHESSYNPGHLSITREEESERI